MNILQSLYLKKLFERKQDTINYETYLNQILEVNTDILEGLVYSLKECNSKIDNL